MIVIIAATALILGIAFYQMVQGLFSTLIMAILTVLCAAVAMGQYENLAELIQPYQPQHAQAGALLALFVIPLLVLRLIIDRVLPRNVVLGVWADRIGGSLLGIVTGTVMVGVLGVILQLLPLGGKVFGWEPFDSCLQRNEHLSFLRADEFVVGMGKLFSDGALRDDQPLSSVHENLLLESFCERNTADKRGSTFAAEDSLRLLGARVLRENIKDPNTEFSWITKKAPFDPLAEPGTNQKFLAVAMEVSDTAREPETSNAKDWYFLPATHFRLVTKNGHDHYPVAYVDDTKGVKVLRLASLKEGKAEVATLIVQRKPLAGDAVVRVTWIFRLPDDEDADYVVFRRLAKVRVVEESHMEIVAFPKAITVVPAGGKPVTPIRPSGLSPAAPASRPASATSAPVAAPATRPGGASPAVSAAKSPSPTPATAPRK